MFAFLKKLFRAPQVGDNKVPSKVGAQGDIESLKAFVTFIAEKLVDYPDKVSVDTVEEDQVISLRISCEKCDVGKIVGKHGKTIAAIRSLVNGAGGRLGRKTMVEVID